MLARAHPGMRTLPAYFLSRPHFLNVEFAAAHIVTASHWNHFSALVFAENTWAHQPRLTRLWLPLSPPTPPPLPNDYQGMEKENKMLKA